MCIFFFFHRIAHGNSRYVMFIDELYIYSLWIVLHVFELFKNEFDKKTWLFGLKEQFSGGDFKTVRGVRIICVFELIGNLPYVSLDVNFNESLTNDVVSFEQLGPDGLLADGTYKWRYFCYILLKNANVSRYFWRVRQFEMSQWQIIQFLEKCHSLALSNNWESNHGVHSQARRMSVEVFSSIPQGPKDLQ